MIDWEAEHYGPQYAQWGVEATLTPKATGVAVSVTVIDMTRGVAVNAKTVEFTRQHPSPIVLQSLKPCVDVRWSEISARGLTPEALDKGTLTLYPATPREKTWRVRSYELLPCEGDGTGEVRLVLEEINE